jgi:hypothetical protein
MSLYSIIHDREEIRDGFRARVLRPPIRFDSIRTAPLTTNYRIVGTAFDYLLRFFLQRINTGAQTSMWVAEEGVDLIGASEYACGFEQSDSYQKADRERRKADTFLNEAKHQHQAYLKTGVVTDELLFAVLRLAYLDVAYRAGPDRIDWMGLESPDANDIADLRALIALVDESSFRATHVCLLNPTFGAASGLVGGADADLLLDDCIIDIKTTKDPRLDVRDFFQLIGYYLLHGFDGIHCGNSKTTTHEVNSLAIYFSRYGYLWKVAVDEVLPPGSVPDTAKWFFESVCTSKAQRLKYARGFRGPLAGHLNTQEKREKPKSKRRSATKKGRKSLMSNPRFHTDARKSGARR